MKIQNMIKKITIAILSAAMMLAPIVNIKAASTDVVDTSKTGSITIHKYDMTAAKQKEVRHILQASRSMRNLPRH